MSLRIYANVDEQDLPLNTSGVDWVEIDNDNDILIFSAGNDIVKDGAPIPNAYELIMAGTLASETEKTIVQKYFIADYDTNTLKEIHNMGNQNKRYVLAFDFDAATASEPVLEVWDNDFMATADIVMLGEGTPIESWFWGITTTNNLPGSGWLGTLPSSGNRLAGSSAGYYLFLNGGGGALNTGKTLYAQFKIIIPANPSSAMAATPVIVCKYTSN